MMRKINEGGVESDEGYSIQITGPESLEYREKNEIIEIQLSYDPKERKIYIHVTENDDAIKNNMLEVKTNIEKAVKLLAGDYVVI